MPYNEQQLCGNEIDLPFLQQMGFVRSSNANRLSWHSHSGFEILFLLEGRTAYEFKSLRTVELTGGQFMVVPPRVVHRGKHDMRAPCRICGLTLTPLQPKICRNSPFTPDDVACIHAALARSAITIHPLNPPLRWIIKRLMDEADKYWTSPNERTSPAVLRTFICGAILEVVRQIISPPQAPKAIVAAAVAYLGKHFGHAVSIGQLATHLGYSRSRVYELFKSETGLSPNDYLQRLRIENAQRLLCNTKKSVTTIALDLGFNSGQYFCTAFRRYTGVTPARYRKDDKQSKGSRPY
ncbi:MAG: AraC family transcriptional regulator [Verrucomicrobiota bacterium]